MLQPKIIHVEPHKLYELKITYETGEKRIFNVAPYIIGNWFGELRDDEKFKSVRIAQNGIGIEWSGGQDIAPHELYELSVAIE